MVDFQHIKWVDDKGHVKPPIWLYAILVYLARGWCVWIASLTQANDRAAIVRLFYPDRFDFIQALIAGIGAVILFGLVIAERQRKPQWLAPAFRKMMIVLWGLLLLDGVLLAQRLNHADYLFSWFFAVDILLLFWSGLYLLYSKHLKFYVKDWHREEGVVDGQ